MPRRASAEAPIVEAALLPKENLWLQALPLTARSESISRTTTPPPISRSLRLEDIFASHCLLPTQVDRRYHPREYAKPRIECLLLLCDVAMPERGSVRGHRKGSRA